VHHELVIDDVTAPVLALLTGAGATVATAESLTGGSLGALITSVPGASAAYVGGVVSYATAVKVDLLSVPQSVVDTHGVISGQCAEAMAAGVRDLLGATYGLSTTGVAGPDLQDGKPAGTVFVGIAGPTGVRSIELALTGDPLLIRGTTCLEAVSALGAMLETDPGNNSALR
jgi:nicotinamide-nucleotide amidase